MIKQKIQCSEQRALLSVNEQDSISNMISNYGINTNKNVYSINGDIISFNASSIFDGTLDVSIGKFSGIDNVLRHWTGSENNGDAQFHRFNSWSASSGYEGQYATM